MVGGSELILGEILSVKQVHHVLDKSIGMNVQWKLLDSEVRPAADGIAGFLGDHIKVVLNVDVEGEFKKVHLFLKRIPAKNKPKADFIKENNFFRREKFMYQVLEEICDNGAHPWSVKAYIYTDSMVVMPDLNTAGYAPRHFLDTLDLNHFLVTTTSIAHFHAAFMNYETKKIIDLKRPYSTFQEYKDILTDPTFCESPFMKSVVRFSCSLLKKFSTKSYRNKTELESELNDYYLKACDSVKEYKETVNVLLHRDLWINNIMFNYEDGLPKNAVLVDFQCVRYGPPAFDLMMFLYLTTDRSFRERHEKEICHYYYDKFVQNLTGDSKKRSEGLGYDKEDFLNWCEKGRMFALCYAIGIAPFILMDPVTAQKTFDDPETYEKYINFDRSEPVLAYCAKCDVYKNRNLEITEEFVERYVIN